MSVNDKLEDGFTRHQIFVQRYAKGREREAQRYIQRLITGVVDNLGRENLTAYSRARLERLLADLNLYMSQLGTEYTDQVLEEMARFAEYEAEFNFDLLGQHVIADLTLPSPTQIEAAIYTDVMRLEPTKGYTIRDALSEFNTRKQNQIVQQIRDGVVLGQTIDQVASNITSLAPLQRRQAATLARTITNRVSIKARETTMRENDDVVEAYKWVATLDSLTSLICAGRDGTIYKDNDKNPKPPAHFNCRSTITYVVKPEFDLGADIEGERPAIGPNGEITQVKDSTSYAQWLRRQPAAFQDEVLGPGRADLFRKGTLPLSRFVDENGRELTLAELRDLDRQMEGTGTAPTPAEEPTPPGPSEPIRPTFAFTPVEQITFKSAAEARKEIARRFGIAETDDRYDQDKFRFRGRRQDYGKRNTALKNMPPEVAQAYEAVQPELDQLAQVFNIPPLRGLARIRANSRAGADMGDGIMGINAKYQEGQLKNLDRSVIRGGEINQWLAKFDDDTWSEVRKSRSWTADSYFDNRFDGFRSTLYHEFGHHVHQMYAVKPGDYLKTGYGWTPQVEAEMKRAYTKAKRKAPTFYGDTNEKEWFAENFALYFMDKKDKTDPLFRELIEGLLNNAIK
jgi:SPP1 gp7 family putative phage head morphogenesis protein